MAHVDPALLNCVGFLYTTREEKRVAAGTCYFVSATSRYGFTTFSYLVTNRHVWEVLCGWDSYVRLNRNAVQPGELGIEWIQLPRTTKDEPGPWVFHPDSGVDLAVLPLGDLLNNKNVTFACIELTQITATTETVRRFDIPWPPLVGEEVLFVTMMTKFAGRERNHPLTRRGYIALNTDETIRGRYGLSDYYVVEAQCYPGNSGSPVWVLYDFYPDPPNTYRGDKQVFLLGTLAGGQSEDQEVIYKEKREGEEKKTYLNLALGLVVPVEKLCDILNSSELERARDEADTEPSGPPFVPLS
jgi:hypothetical protein